MGIRREKNFVILLVCIGVAHAIQHFVPFAAMKTKLRVIRSYNNLNDTTTDDSESCEMSETEQSEEQDEDSRRKRMVSNMKALGSLEVYNDSSVDENTTESTDVLLRFSEKFLNCSHLAITRGCYTLLLNTSAHVPIYSLVINDSDYYINDDNLYICSDFLGNHNLEPKFQIGLIIVSYIGISISMIFIVLYLCLFVLLKPLRNLPGYCICCLCISLLVAYICLFLPGSHKTYKQCEAIGISLFYFFLVSFFWMNVVSFDIWRSLRMATSKLRFTGSKGMWTRFAVYSAYVWGLPLLSVITAIEVTKNESVTVSYRLIFNKERCWFNYKEALLVYFAVPLFIILGLNVVFFASSFYMITRASMKTAENRATLWNRFLVSIRLAVVMGLTWCFGVIATATESEVMYYFFTIFNSLQGVFIFFGFGFSGKTRKALQKKFRSQDTSTSRTQITSQQGPSVTTV